MTLRVIIDGPAAGRLNMEKDSALAEALDRGEIPPTLRLYSWNPPALSIGYHQSASDFDTEKLRAAGIDLVRRPTGGRAILHWHELTYAIVLPLSSGAPRALYERVHEALLAGIGSLGIAAVLGGSDEGLRAAYENPGGVACFSRSVRSEIQAGGKKLAGSAQRKTGRVVLQHGSFLLGTQHRRIAGFIRSGTGGATAPDLTAGTTEAETILGRSVSFGEAADAVAASFTDRFSTDARPARRVPVDAVSA
jgi:lipoate-protein ligase A